MILAKLTKIRYILVYWAYPPVLLWGFFGMPDEFLFSQINYNSLNFTDWRQFTVYKHLRNLQKYGFILETLRSTRYFESKLI